MDFLSSSQIWYSPKSLTVNLCISLGLVDGNIKICVRKVCVARSSVEILRQASTRDSRGSTRANFSVQLNLRVFQLHRFNGLLLLRLLMWSLKFRTWHNPVVWWCSCEVTFMFFKVEVLRTEKYLSQLRGFKMAESQPCNSCQAAAATLNVGFVKDSIFLKRLSHKTSQSRKELSWGGFADFHYPVYWYPWCMNL